METKRINAENSLAYVIYNGFPVTEYHALIISKSHTETYFDLTSQEREAFHQLLIESKDKILKK